MLMEYLKSLLSDESGSNSICEIQMSQTCRERLRIVSHMRDYRIPPRCKRDIRSSGMLRNIGW